MSITEADGELIAKANHPAVRDQLEAVLTDERARLLARAEYLFGHPEDLRYYVPESAALPAWTDVLEAELERTRVTLKERLRLVLRATDEQALGNSTTGAINALRDQVMEYYRKCLS